MGRRSPNAPRGQQRWGQSDQPSEQSRFVAVTLVTLEVQGDEKLGLRRSWFAFGVAGGPGCTKVLQRSRCGFPGGPASRDGDCSPLKQPRIWQKFAWPVSVTSNMPRQMYKLPYSNCELQWLSPELVIYGVFGHVISFFEFPMIIPAW